MSDREDIVKIAVDGYYGVVDTYSVRDSQDTVRKALIEANGGDTKLDVRRIRDGKCGELFAIIEEVLKQTEFDDLKQDDFFNAVVDYRNLAEGDMNEFVIQDSNVFVVDEIAKGTQGIRRQRIGGERTVSIPTTMKAVRFYEELNRVLAGKVDFNNLIAVLNKSFSKKVLQDIYDVWSNITADDIGGVEYYPTAGTYDEDVLLELIEHVEAAADGKPATIIGTKKAVRQLKESIQSDSAKEELHKLGVYGTFFGTPVVVLPQRHKTGTKTFVFEDNVLHIIAGDDKFIKFVWEGNSLILPGDPTRNADLTQELTIMMSHNYSSLAQKCA
ncbi:MAG: hypothetical protein II410_05480 [Ruminococcus sp.]|nr:hypothetical protein [Ruminococcus sp.]